MKTICIDFDGVIHDYTKGWQGIDVFGKPIEGASAGTKELKNQGWTIILFTTRNDTPALREWLKANDIAYDYINYNPKQPKGSDKGKIIADIYLDDRGICFRGDWTKTIEDINKFELWYKKE